MSLIAVVQCPPAYLDRTETLKRGVAAIAEAAQSGARLVVFPEAFIPGYPVWIWRLRPGADMRLTEQLHSRLRANAIDLAGDDLAPLCKAAGEHNVSVGPIDPSFDRPTTRPASSMTSTSSNATVSPGRTSASMH